MARTEQIEGIFLSIPDDELADLYDRLEIMGHTRDAAGLREFIRLAMYEDPDEGGADRSMPGGGFASVFQYVQENPEQVRMAAATAANFCRGLFVRRKGK